MVSLPSFNLNIRTYDEEVNIEGNPEARLLGQDVNSWTPPQEHDNPFIRLPARALLRTLSITLESLLAPRYRILLVLIGGALVEASVVFVVVVVVGKLEGHRSRAQVESSA
ncbi:hypothetical protein BHE90_012038 [Fusarium euwallaceae]|uniref:Uncharacterized protein n=2 Tax=Fusarium solani species complex TaxID=232080 RepID=A0A428TA80_9HYPO|nr:hypothetical protein CEP52_010039 [Fusarium oligoseptatum]RTE73523.1 hypothetical protein BHE90_012038 [Fusarium euwallaceae]